MATLVERQSTEHGPNILIGRMVQAFGKPFKYQVEGLTHLFPTPEALADADLTNLGFSSSFAQAIRKLSGRVSTGEFRFDSSKSLEETISRVHKFCGVSERMAQYFAMRAFGEPDAFPVSDPHLGQVAEKCRPWRAYAAMHLAWPECQFVFNGADDPVIVA